ncbi:MAG: hypothetical protein ACKOTA_07925, partial [Solirubrobacterales bacterium]
GDLADRVPVVIGDEEVAFAVDVDAIGTVEPAAGTLTSFSVGFNPRAVTVDSAGNVYVANTNSASISKITAGGTVSASFASGGGLNGPNGIDIDSEGNLFVANYNGDTVSKITPAAGDIQPAPPARPSAPTATPGDAKATVSVTANPADRRFGEPTSYTVTAVEDTGRTCTVTPPATSCQVTGLTNGTPYTFTARANLNTWQTGASAASASVIPTAAPTPTPTPTPTPPPPPTPTPPATVAVASVKSKVSRKGAYITSRVTVSGAGAVSQRATTGSKKLKTWCRVSKTATTATAHTLKCNLGSKGRRALRKGSLKLTLRTTFTPTTGTAATSDRKLTIKRKR